MVSRDDRVMIDSTDLIKHFIIDILSYRAPHKRHSTHNNNNNAIKLTKKMFQFSFFKSRTPTSNNEIQNVPTSKKLLREHKHDFFGEVPLEHFYRMSGTFFNFKIEIVGHLETFRHDWFKKVVPEYPVLKKRKAFMVNTGNHKTSVNHPANKGKWKNMDLQRTRYFYRLLLKSEPSVVRAICHMVLIDYVCFSEYQLPPECAHLNSSVLDARSLLLI